MSVGPPTLTHLLAREQSRARPPATARARATLRARPAAGPAARQWFEAEPLWFKRAVFYEIHIRGFFDGNGDGSGDFRGLTEKLDYLQWLGIDCIWLLPFYESPLRDGGYDISDFTKVHPDYGIGRRRPGADRRRPRPPDPGDRRSGDEPHLHRTTRGSRSRARARTTPSATGTCGRTPTSATSDARIIFTDTETSNWTYDPVAGAYYWHRFFSHQPDLNYDNPEVQRRDDARCCASGSTWASTASGSTPSRTCTSARARSARTCPRPTRT